MKKSCCPYTVFVYLCVYEFLNLCVCEFVICVCVCVCVLQVAQEGKETSPVKESKSRERQGTLFPSQLFLISYSAETQSALIFNLLSLRMSQTHGEQKY